MFLTIFKDSVILFLLIYALISLAEGLCHFLSERLTKPGFVSAKKIHILDISNTQTEWLEYYIRKEASTYRDTVYITSKQQIADAEYIVKRLRRQYPELYYVSPEELINRISSPSDGDAFSKAEQAASQAPDK